MTLQTFRPGMWVPHPVHQYGTTSPIYALDASGKRSAFIFESPITGTIETVEFLVASNLLINAASVVRISLQDVAARYPDGTQDAYRDMTGASLAASTWKAPGSLSSDGTDTGTKKSVTAKDILSIVWEYNSFTAADVFSVAQTSGGNTGRFTPHFPYAAHYTGAVWASADAITEFYPLIAVKYTTGQYVFLAPELEPWSGDLTIYRVASDTAPSEVGLRFSLPIDCQIQGASLYMSSSTNAGFLSDFEVVVYDDGSTPLATAVMRKNDLKTVGGLVYVIFSDDVNIGRNGIYRLAVKPLDGDPQKAGLYVDQISNPLHQRAIGGGEPFYFTYRTGSGPWTDNVLARPRISLRFAAFSNFVSGGPTAGGVTGRAFNRGMIS